ncbi:MAG: hypothetical protein QOD49_958, partial [Actinomycetota bacterium]|nr:hypothetical protein [Actinomycetota bacterium]
MLSRLMSQVLGLGPVPWPMSNAVCEPAVSLKVKVALRGPAEVGWKVTFTLQLDPPATLAPKHES